MQSPTAFHFVTFAKKSYHRHFAYPSPLINPRCSAPAAPKKTGMSSVQWHPSHSQAPSILEPHKIIAKDYEAKITAQHRQSPSKSPWLRIVSLPLFHIWYHQPWSCCQLEYLNPSSWKLPCQYQMVNSFCARPGPPQKGSRARRVERPEEFSTLSCAGMWLSNSDSGNKTSNIP